MKGKVVFSTVVCVLFIFSIFTQISSATTTDSKSPSTKGSWTQTTDTEFNGGTRIADNTVIKGSAQEGSLILNKDNFWKEIKHVETSKIPSGRVFHAMCYDQHARVMVLFGGSSLKPSEANETWIYDLSANIWIQKFPKTAPTGRYGHAIVYSPDIGMDIMFGGFDITNDKPYNDTWFYDICKNMWENKTKGNTPTARGYHGMTYDINRGVVVLFSGATNPSPSFAQNDTWEFNPKTVSWKGPIAGPPSLIMRIGHSIVYDTLAKKTILFGGQDVNANPLNDTWAYDGGWTFMNPQGTPAARYAYAMTYDESIKCTVVFSGTTMSTPSPDIWTYDYGKNTWMQRTSPSTYTPPYTQYGEMIFYKDRSMTILLGGIAAGPPDNILWMLDPDWKWNNNNIYPVGGSSIAVTRSITNTIISYDGWTYSYDINNNIWTRIDKSSFLREDPAMVYWIPQDTIILYGGANGITKFDQTWYFNFTMSLWENQGVSPAPLKRSKHAMVYEENRDLILMYGGSDGSMKYPDTWVYDPNQRHWSEKIQSTPPPAREEHAMTYATDSGRVVLFGGRGDSGLLNDTWVYDSLADKWNEKTPLLSPTKREGHSMIFDSFNKKVILFGGKGESSNYLNDMWEYDIGNNKWTEYKPLLKPQPRWNAGATYCDWNNEAIVVHGIGSTLFNDTWVYPAYKYNGTFISSKWDTGMSLIFLPINPDLKYGRIWWNNTGPYGSIAIQLRTAASSVSLDTATWYGPTSVNDYYYVSGSDINPIHKDTNGRWIQYKLLINTTNAATTPELKDITITYEGDIVVPDIGTSIVPMICIIVIMFVIILKMKKRKSLR